MAVGQTQPCGADQCSLRQAAPFQPRGLLGIAYGFAVARFHHFVFRGVLLGIQREALRIEDGPDSAETARQSQ